MAECKQPAPTHDESLSALMRVVCHPQDPKVDYWMFARYITFIVTTLLCYAATVSQHCTAILDCS